MMKRIVTWLTNRYYPISTEPLAIDWQISNYHGGRVVEILATMKDGKRRVVARTYGWQNGNKEAMDYAYRICRIMNGLPPN